MSDVGLNLSNPAPTEPANGGRSAVTLLIVAVIVIAIVGAIGYVVWRQFASGPDYPGPGVGAVTVQVKPGDSITAIGTTLEAEDVVASESAFVSVASGDPRARGIQAGYYEMRQQMSAQGALDILVDPPNRVALRVTVPEGMRATAIAALLAAETGIEQSSLEKHMKDPEGLGLPDYADGDVEGFLFPATYEVEPGATAQSVLRMMVTAYKQTVAELNMEERAAELGYTPYQILTIASLVQAEGLEADFGKIARVIENRLDCTLPACNEIPPVTDRVKRLQFDSTINYAKDSNILDLSAQDLGEDGPYNTHLNAGLPPTPINNPGAAAIRAALNPTPGSWLFFVADSGVGFSQFSDNLAQHDQAVAEWNRLRANS